MTSSGTLYMLPSPLDAGAACALDTPAAVRDCAHRLDYFLVESAKSARATLKRLEHPTPLRELDIVELPPEHYADYMLTALWWHGCQPFVVYELLSQPSEG